MKRPDGVELSRGYTVARYRALEAGKNRKEIAKLLSKRFTERYLAPTLSRQNVKHGFARLAIGCLMVEALESFRCGLPRTRNKSEPAFRSFFDAHTEFAVDPTGTAMGGGTAARNWTAYAQRARSLGVRHVAEQADAAAEVHARRDRRRGSRC